MFKTITIDDFSGGRTNFLDQTTIQNNVCSSGSANVWSVEKVLTKTPGVVLQASFTASGSAQAYPWIFLDDTVSTAFQIFYKISQTATGNPTVYPYLFGSSTTLTDNLTLLGYTTGSISISGANLISATGNGTSWLTNVTAGDLITINSLASGKYTVSSVEDNTHLTLTSAVGAAVATGTSYIISMGSAYPEIAAASLNGNFCMVTTGDLMQNYSSTGMIRMSSAPSAAFLTVHKGYMFAARTNTAESRLYWSAINDPTSWPTNNFTDVDKVSGKITGLFNYGYELIVFKTRGMYKVIGNIFDSSNPTYQIIKIAVPSDFIFGNNYTCAIHKGTLIFYGYGKFYRYASGTLFIQDISPTIIRDLPTLFGAYNDVHNNAEQKVPAIDFRNNYIIKGLPDPNDTASDTAITFILDENNSWWSIKSRNNTTNNTPFGTGRFIVVPSTTSRPLLVTIMQGSPKIVSWDFIGPTFGTSYLDTAAGWNGATTSIAINGNWVSKEFNIEYGVFKWIIVYLQKQSAGNLTVKWSIDQATAVSYAVDMTTGRGQVIRAVIPINQKGSTIQLTLNNNTGSQTFRIYAIKIIYEESPMERIL